MVKNLDREFGKMLHHKLSYVWQRLWWLVRILLQQLQQPRYNPLFSGEPVMLDAITGCDMDFV